MAAKFRVVLRQGDDETIVDESFTAESVEQILQCKPDGVLHVEAVKVSEIGPESVSDETVWLELISMRENLAEALMHDREVVLTDSSIPTAVA